jgi:hypothetical protein
MQLDAYSKLEGFESNKQQKIEFWIILAFNIFMYLFLLVLIIIVAIDGYSDFFIIARSFKSVLEFTICLGIIFAGVKLLLTIKKMMSSVPKNLLIWILVGGITSIVKFGEQFFFYIADKENLYSFQISVFVLISYNLTDLIPTFVLLRSFKVYSRFLRHNRDSIDSFDQLISEKLKSLDLD